MPNLSRKPAPEISDAREAAIHAGIANDPDNPEITAAEFARMRPASAMLPPALYAKLVARGRPKAEVTKVPVKIRLDRPTVEAFKNTGAGWQTRINDVLANAAAMLRSAGSGDVAMVPRAKTSRARAKALVKSIKVKPAPMKAAAKSTVSKVGKASRPPQAVGAPKTVKSKAHSSAKT